MRRFWEFFRKVSKRRFSTCEEDKEQKKAATVVSGKIQTQGIDAEIEVFDGLAHGFGLGEGTVAEGWIDRAVSFWERNMK